MHTCTYVCMYACMYTYMHTYTHTYIRTHKCIWFDFIYGSYNCNRIYLKFAKNGQYVYKQEINI